MVWVRPFRAVRPRAELAAQVAALPYDVYTRQEAAEAVLGRPLSFLRIDRPETLFPPDTDMYAQIVYEAAGERYRAQRKEGVFVPDTAPCYYLYELSTQGHTQTGLVALSSVDDYLSGRVLRHETTLASKEQDRICHIRALRAQTGPILLAYRDDAFLKELFGRWQEKAAPVYDFTSDEGVAQRVWVIDDPLVIEAIGERFGAMAHTYIADGHHRAASAVRVALSSGDHGEASPESGFFLSVLFPAGELNILDYNRVARLPGGMGKAEFLGALSADFELRRLGAVCDIGIEALRPGRKYDFGLYLAGDIYICSLRESVRKLIEGDPVRSLDVSLLQEYVLSPILGITDPSRDERLSFVGGAYGMSALIALADETGGAAFAMYPTSMDELMNAADHGLLMPPKSTWFEPKLRSGLFIHELGS